MGSIAAMLLGSVGTSWAVGVVTITGLVVLDTWLNVGVSVFSIRCLRGEGTKIIS